MDRKAFLKTTLCCAAGCLAPLSSVQAGAEAPDSQLSAADAAFLRGWLSKFIAREEKHMDRTALVTLLEERGRACCRALDFRQKLIKDSEGSLDKLVELLGQIVGPENAVRHGNTVTLVYPKNNPCRCGWSPKREPSPDDPYCHCSKANNQELFRIVTGRTPTVEVTESPRRGGSQCRFVIRLA